MRYHIAESGITVNVIAGTYVVFFGLDLSKSKRKGFRGFAIKRTDHHEGETVWMRGMKTFKETAPHPALGENFSTREHPIQSFQWSDYSAKPDRKYTYTVEAMYGTPGDLKNEISLSIDIETEPEIGGVHSVFFNRGSVATQEYARRYQDQPPNKAGQGAYDWLSRGLIEALFDYLGQASSGWTIHAAIYEFQWPTVLKAVKAAKGRGAKVHVIYDEIEAYRGDEPSGPWYRNMEAIADAKIKKLCKGRRNGKLMHNKFFILSHNEKPISVWTGSTNLTENGIFGHSNMGHIVNDSAVAQQFLDYWQRLNGDPLVDAEYRQANMADGSTPPEVWDQETVAVFSPRGTGLEALDWYASLADQAQKGLFMTFAFGMHPKFQEVYQKDDNVLRMALMETVRRSPKTADQDAEDISKIRQRPNVVVAIGNRIPVNSFDRWLKEISRVKKEVHVQWIHTKYMLIDPLSDHPIVVTGSANFSAASTDTNDENMLVIQGNKRIADIYFGEYQRLYTHYAFREKLKRDLERKKLGKSTEWEPKFLATEDKWMDDYLDSADKSARFTRREYFSGALSI